MKDGSGDLDFGGDEDESTEPENAADKSESVSAETGGDELEDESSSISTESESKYPYFVRRSNVGDERDKRLEVHVREEVAEQEAAFRAELAEKLGVSEISKTDAREFALVAAFEDPDTVAEQMREEGFGELE
jgi:hypothetical protein